METRNFMDLLKGRWSYGNFVCIRLNPEMERVSLHGGASASAKEGVLDFNNKVVSATEDLVLAYELDLAFYIQLGSRGVEILRQTVASIREQAPDVPVIIGIDAAGAAAANSALAKTVFRDIDADAVTAHAFAGREALAPFLDWETKGVIVVCRSLGHGADEFQSLVLAEYPGHAPAESFCMRVARNVSGRWNGMGNCAISFSTNDPPELENVRNLVGEMPILFSGVGDVKNLVAAGRDRKGSGFAVVSPSHLIYPKPSPRDARYSFSVAIREQVVGFRNAVNDWRLANLYL